MVKNKADINVRIHLGVFYSCLDMNVTLSNYLLSNILNIIIVELSYFCSAQGSHWLK